MLKWRSGRPLRHPPSIAHPPMRMLGDRRRPPPAALPGRRPALPEAAGAAYARVELIEVREDEQVPGGSPNAPTWCCSPATGSEFDSSSSRECLEERRQAARDLCFVIGGPRGLDLERCDMKLSFGADDAAAPARARGAARAALPGAQDPRPRAVPLLSSRHWTPIASLTHSGRARPPPSVAGNGRRAEPQARPAAQRRLRRLLDQRGDAAGAVARRAAARGRRAARRRAERAARRRRRARRGRRARASSTCS